MGLSKFSKIKSIDVLYAFYASLSTALSSFWLYFGEVSILLSNSSHSDIREFTFSTMRCCSFSGG
jgi:hypothetical protein